MMTTALLCRRVLVMEFVRGQKLSLLPREEIRSLVEVGQNAFLVQLLDVGYLHAGGSLLLGIFLQVRDDAELLQALLVVLRVP